jgi:hypothetical protein
MILYTDFILPYPAYGNLPYTEQYVTANLNEIAILHPAIYDCLPEEARMLATYYAFKMLELEADCDATEMSSALSYSSMNDKVVYNRAKNPGALSNTLYGQKLNRLYRIYGCFYYVAKRVTPESC